MLAQPTGFGRSPALSTTPWLDRPPDQPPSRRHRVRCRWSHCRSSRCRTPANATSNSRLSRSESAPEAAGRARTTSRPPSGSWSIRWLTTARSLRLTRLRTTAFPTAFETTNPTTTAAGSTCSPARWRTSEPFPERTPLRTARSKSAGRRIRCAAGSTRAGSGGELGATLAAPTRKDCAARTGAHPQPETMGLRAAPVVRLKRPLGHESLQLLRGNAPTGNGRRRSTADLDDSVRTPGTCAPNRHGTGAINDGRSTLRWRL